MLKHQQRVLTLTNHEQQLKSGTCCACKPQKQGQLNVLLAIFHDEIEPVKDSDRDGIKSRHGL